MRHPGRAFWAVLVFAVIFWGMVACTVKAVASYEVHPWKYDHAALVIWDVSNVHGSECARAVTGEEAPVAEAMALWTAHGNITYVDGFVLMVAGESTGHIDIFIGCGPDHAISDIATAEPHVVGGFVDWCEVLLGSRFFGLAAAGQVRVLAHELGHCVGVYHSNDAGVMMFPLIHEFSADDAAAIAWLYPYPHQLTVTVGADR